jgi:hypothetical protein
MGSLFDSRVYDRRNHTPWSNVSLTSFIGDVVMNFGIGDNRCDAEVVLKCIYRHDVASRMWWTLSWLDAGGERRQVSAQRYDLLLWRAAEVELREQKKQEFVKPEYIGDMVLEAICAKSEEKRMEVLKKMAKQFGVRLEEDDSDENTVS